MRSTSLSRGLIAFVVFAAAFAAGHAQGQVAKATAGKR